MDYIGMDVGKKVSQISIVTDDGEVIDLRIRTERHRLVDIFGRRPPAKILLEASTESEWVARCLEGVGHEVIVADPNYAPMYAQRTRRVKTDRRDARALAQACKLGAYRAAHRVSDSRQQLRALLGIREAMVRTRARWITQMQALLRREGVRMGAGAAETFKARIDELSLPAPLRMVMSPLLTLLEPLNQQIELLDHELQQLVARDDVTRRLVTVPGVGPVTAVAFVAALDNVTRFPGAHQVESYLGLVPREWSSSEKQRRGRITKTGSARVRWLLVQSAWCILRRRTPEVTALRAWAERIASRRGRLIAVVALARRLAGVLYAIWRDGTEYNPAKLHAAASTLPA